GSRLARHRLPGQGAGGRNPGAGDQRGHSAPRRYRYDRRIRCGTVSQAGAGVRAPLRQLRLSSRQVCRGARFLVACHQAQSTDVTMLDFSEKTILVTGASQGIGLGIARGFAQAGGRGHITGTRASADSYEDDLSAFDYHQADLATSAGREQLHAAVPEIDVLVNNAGIALDNEFEIDGFRQTIEMNLIGVMELCLLYRATLVERKGSIVNVGSLASYLSLKE